MIPDYLENWIQNIERDADPDHKRSEISFLIDHLRKNYQDMSNNRLNMILQRVDQRRQSMPTMRRHPV